MISPLTRIAQIQLCSEGEARQFCLSVQQLCGTPPSFAVIARVVEQLGALSVDTQEVAQQAQVLHQKKQQPPTTRAVAIPPPSHTDVLSTYHIWPLSFIKDVDSFENMFARIPTNVRQQLQHRVTGVTGWVPYDGANICTVIRKLGGTVGDEGIWEHEQIIVVGREEFDANYLLRTVQVSIQYEFTCRFMAQEAFWHFLLCGEEPAYYKGDPRIRDHKGLLYLTTIGFEWPSTVAHPSNDVSDLDLVDGWRPQHELRAVYGYNVDEKFNLLPTQRYQCLTAAVRGLGLPSVAEHIAWCVQNAKRRRDNHMQRAIEKWEDDLDWLYDTFYKRSTYQFVWPSTYRHGRRK